MYLSLSKAFDTASPQHAQADNGWVTEVDSEVDWELAEWSGLEVCDLWHSVQLESSCQSCTVEAGAGANAVEHLH